MLSWAEMSAPLEDPLVESVEPGDGPVAPPEPNPSAVDTLIEDRGDALAVAFFLALLVLSLASVIWLFQSFLSDIVLALVAATLSRGPYADLLRRTGRPAVAAGLICAAIVIGVAVPVTFLGVSLSAEAATVIELTRTSVSLDLLEEWLFGEGWTAEQIRGFAAWTGVELNPTTVKRFINGAAGTVAQAVYEVVNGLLANVLAGLFHFLIVLALVFYLLVDGARFRRYVFRLSPLPDAHEALLLEKFGDVGRAILFGNGIGSAIQGVLGGLAMSAVGLPSPVLWGTVMAVLAFLPVVGVSVVVLPATAYLVLTGRLLAAIGFFAFCGVMALVVENVVKSRLIGSHMQMHDLLVFLSVIGGLAMFGVLGLLYGPLLLTLFLTLAELYQTTYKHRIVDPLAGPR